eukprot:746957-Hanusia_phi.AAC.2
MPVADQGKGSNGVLESLCAVEFAALSLDRDRFARAGKGLCADLPTSCYEYSSIYSIGIISNLRIPCSIPVVKAWISDPFEI